MAVIPDATAPTLRAFLLAHVERGSVVVTDGLKSYPSAVGPDYSHRPFNVAGSGQPAHVPLPGVHRVASLAKRWLLGTHQGAVEADHLQVYLNEFCFRFNRRSSRSRGLLFFRLMQLAAGAPPVTYRQMVVNPKSKRTRPTPPAGHRSPARKPRPSASRATLAGGHQPGLITGLGQSDGYPLLDNAAPRAFSSQMVTSDGVSLSVS